MPDLPVTHLSPFSTWFGYSFFPPPLIKPRCQGRVMGFVGGDGNIAIATALLPSFCVLYYKHQIVYQISISYFYACLKLRFLDVETNPGLRHPISTVCRLLSYNVRGQAGNLNHLTVASSRHDILLCTAETLVSDMCHVSELQVPGFGRPVLCRGRMALARGN